MAHRVIQFPVRNAFAPRSHDSLARETQDHAHRIAEQVENEIARQAERLATGRSAEYARARTGGLITMRPTSRTNHLRKQIAAFRAATAAFTSRLFTRP